MQTSIWCRVRRVGSLGLWLAVIASPGVQASGFAVPELSTAGIGMANALVANAEDPGAFPYNAAAMGFHEASSLSIGGLLIAPSFELDNASGSHESHGADWVGAPMVQAAARITERLWAGLAINAPFGLETRWRPGTFPKLTGIRVAPAGFPEPTIPLSPQPLQSKLEVIAVAPTVTYALNGQVSLSAGIDYYWVKSAVLDSSLTELDGDGTGWGFNLGSLYRQGPWSFGAAFHSAATIEVEGSYQPLSQNLVLLNQLVPGRGLPPAQDAELDLHLPWRLQLGARYAFTDELAVELDWTRTGWSEFDKITIVGRDSGAVIQEDTNSWSDASAYRLGLTYQWRPRTQLRLGYSFDETGQGDELFSARIPDSDRHLFGVGIGHDLGEGWSLEAGYMYVRFKDRDYRSSRPYDPREPADINGTDALDGDYAASAHLVGLEVRKTF